MLRMLGNRPTGSAAAVAAAGALVAAAVGVAVAPSASAITSCGGQTFNTFDSTSTCAIAAGETVNFTILAGAGGVGESVGQYVGGQGGVGGLVTGSYTNNSGALETITVHVGAPGMAGFGPTQPTSATDNSIAVGATLIAVVSGGAGGTNATVAGNGTNGADGGLVVPSPTPAGWTVSARGGLPSVAFTSPTPPTPQTIIITGSRVLSDTTTIRVAGKTTGLVDAEVTPWFRYAGQTRFTQGVGVRTVSAKGTFTWSRTSNKRTSIYFTSGDARSNTVTVIAP